MLNVRLATEADYPSLLTLMAETMPMPPDPETFIRLQRRLAEQGGFTRLVAMAPGGEVAGTASARSGTDNRPGECFIRVVVRPGEQRKGYGGALYQGILGYVPAATTFITTNVADDDPVAQSWAERRGYEREHHIFQSELDLTEFNAEAYAHTIPGIRFTTLANEIAAHGEAAWQRYYDLHFRLWVEIPGFAGRQNPPIERWREEKATSKTFRPDGVIIAIYGDDWVGISEITLHPTGVLNNDFTGVAPGFRGKGLSLALKVEGLRWAKTQASRILTYNHSQNAPMLATNRRLGYQPKTGIYSLVRHL